MKWLFASLVFVHGLIHFLGPVKAFHWAAVNQFRAPISPSSGVLWLLVALMLIAAAAGLALGASWWWYPALPGVLLSQGLIVSAWGDAKWGTVANLLIAIPLLVTLLDMRPSSLRSRFL